MIDITVHNVTHVDLATGAAPSHDGRGVQWIHARIAKRWAVASERHAETLVSLTAFLRGKRDTLEVNMEDATRVYLVGSTLVVETASGVTFELAFPQGALAIENRGGAATDRAVV